MGARLCTTNRWITLVATCLLLLVLAGPPRSLAHDEWYRGLDLESALADSGLVLVGRVTDVSETKLGVGGKGERSLPLRPREGRRSLARLLQERLHEGRIQWFCSTLNPFIGCVTPS